MRTLPVFFLPYGLCAVHVTVPL